MTYEALPSTTKKVFAQEKKNIILNTAPYTVLHDLAALQKSNTSEHTFKHILVILVIGAFIAIRLLEWTTLFPSMNHKHRAAKYNIVQ